MPHTIHSKLQQKKLQYLKTNMVSGMFADQQHRKKLEQVTQLIENALFLQDEEERKKKWLAVLKQFDSDFLDGLAQAIIQENLLFKQKKRDIRIELRKQSKHSHSYR